MRVFVTGVAGQLGHDVVNELVKRGYEAVGTDLAAEYTGVQDGTAVTTAPYVGLDITDAKRVDEIITEAGVDAVIHCAAWTAVDKAEECEDLVRKINAGGTENIAKVCKKLDIPMMYFSTDYVFDGQGTRPWEPEDAYAPLGAYGRTKAEGEQAVKDNLEKYFILRIAWVFGINGKNFIKTMLNLAKTHDTLRVVNDQIGNPTYTYDLARLVVDMIVSDKYGIYHVTNEGESISWYDFACAIMKEGGADHVTVNPCTSAEYGAQAVRPYNSRMDRSKIAAMGFEPLPTWQDALSRYVKILKETGAI
ncbi:MAG: dTDP-4-dehydrorhamnose reductase [Lachnospiraceae bacterium]|nr:dTDP-4-dehydrorhamnose reductase [Candidatus Equihabitans merdae]